MSSGFGPLSEVDQQGLEFLSVHLTDHEVALAIPLGVILGAAVSVLGQVVAARTTLRGQRRLAEDERIFQQRASTYVKLVKELHNVIEIDVIWNDLTLEKVEQYQSVYSRVFDLTPSMIAFSSPEIREKFTKWVARFRTAKLYLEVVNPQRSRELVSETLDEIHLLTDGAYSLIRDVTADLGISVPRATTKRFRLKPRVATSLSTLEGPPPESET